MSDGGRVRVSPGVEVWKSSQNWSVRRSAVRSIAWLGLVDPIAWLGASVALALSRCINIELKLNVALPKRNK
jgi:hypothetical protein